MENVNPLAIAAIQDRKVTDDECMEEISDRIDDREIFGKYYN